jgi:phage terminase small subunit
MSSLRNPRHEQFAQLIAAGKTPAEAYVLVGYAEKTAYTCGPQLLKQTSVGARVAELQPHSCGRHCYQDLA